jgi:hypothetical protein
MSVCVSSTQLKTPNTKQMYESEIERERERERENKSVY